MSEYTPDTSEVRHSWMTLSDGFVFDDLGPEFDRWLASVKAEAWDDGYDQGWQSRKEFDLDGIAEQRNPYREEPK